MLMLILSNHRAGLPKIMFSDPPLLIRGLRRPCSISPLPCLVTFKNNHLHCLPYSQGWNPLGFTSLDVFISHLLCDLSPIIPRSARKVYVSLYVSWWTSTSFEGVFRSYSMIFHGYSMTFPWFPMISHDFPCCCFKSALEAQFFPSPRHRHSNIEATTSRAWHGGWWLGPPDDFGCFTGPPKKRFKHVGTKAIPGVKWPSSRF